MPRAPSDDDEEDENTALTRSDSDVEVEEESCASAVYQAFAQKIAVLIIASPVAWALRIIWTEEEVEPIYHFFSNFFAIIPIAWGISVCTEHLEVKVGPTWGTLLNSTFGNVVEMILSVQVIRAGARNPEQAWLFKIVQSSLLGAVLMNLLFVLGSCFFVVGLKRADTQFNMHSSIYSLCLLSVASMALVVPTAMATFDEWSTMESRLWFSRGIALCLLAMYVQWLVFTLVSHKAMFDGSSARELNDQQLPLGKTLAGSIAEKNEWEEQIETEPPVPFDIAVCPYGVLGMQKTRKKGMQQTGAEPSPSVAIVDPAGLKYIRSSPGGAGGAAGALYEWLDIRDDTQFPEPVRLAIRQSLDAKLHTYGQKTCIHVVGPDFRKLSGISRGEAVQQLALAYKNVMAEFAASNLAVLRLLPISGGIFSGKFGQELTEMTGQAVHLGFRWLTAMQQRLVQTPGRSVEMCIFGEGELPFFEEAIVDPSPLSEVADEEPPTMPLAVAAGILLFATVLVSFHCDFLVEAINPVTEELGVKKAFVATVVLPLVGNFSEVIAALSIASKGKLDLAMEIAIASATQIAMVVVPVAVLIGWALDANLDLDFEVYQVHLLCICILVTSLMLQDGHANWLKGTMLMTTYLIVASSFWFISDREFRSAGDKAPVHLQCNMTANGTQAVCFQMIAATQAETI